MSFLFFNILFAQNTKKVSIQFNWKYQFEFAGYIAAKEKGFYEDAGFDVELKEYKHGIDIEKDVQNGISTFGIYDTSIIDNYDKNKPIILLANYLKISPLIFITKRDIFSPKELKNKTISMSTFEFKNSSLKRLLDKFNIKQEDINIKSFGSIKEFMDGKVDAISAFITNEPFILQKNKIEYNIINPSNFEIKTLGESLFSSLSYLKNNTRNIKNFIEATNKGWLYALNNKEEIIDIIYNKYSKYKSKDALRYEAKKIESLMLLDSYNIGEIRQDILSSQLEEAKKTGKIDKNIQLNQLVYSLSKYSKNYDFSKDEISYLEKKDKIIMCIAPNRMPFEEYKNGKYSGIISDFMKFFEKELHIPLLIYPTKSFKDSLDAIKQKKCDIISEVISNEKRKKYLDITKPYLTFPLAIATKNNIRYINSLDDILDDKKIAVGKDYAFSEFLIKKYPNKNFILVNSVEEGLDRVLQDEVYGFIDSLTTLGYRLQNSYFSELKIAGKLDENFDLSIGVRNDQFLLYSIFEKLVQKLEVSTKHEIMKKWISINYENNIDYKFFWKVFIVLIIILFIITYRYREVLDNKKKIQKEREKLREKNNELKKAQIALEESISNFEVLLDSIMEAVLVFKDHNCIDINKVGYKLLGYNSKDEVIGKNLYHHVHDDFVVTLKELLNKDLDFYEIELVKKDGTIFPALVKDRYIYLNNERVKLFTIVDLTELKNKDRLLFKQSKLASMGEMIGNIAHQWRQPLSLISTISTGLKLKIEANLDDKKESIEFLDKLNSTAQHLSSTIDDFRNFFAADKRKEKFSLVSMIEQNLVLLDSIFKTNFINVVLNIDKTLYVNTYKNELTQALLNILNNASDAYKEKKTVEDKYIFIDAYKQNNSAVITIKDNAGGIPENIIENIFEPYFTTKHKSDGTGIGLYMTYQIINEHIYGKIEAFNCRYSYNNRLYKGAVFKITIPLD
ncbi:ABC transporter substrate-binding protein [Malaciobacter molluscorum]|uniref:ABC transporter substrate-binding protein n=1 Tax=Malaciobacter molluscorum TaxID=1032072 RepID=UPI00100AFCF0|nr:ABC transporter substrate-binding protein [Malaciobacter molluscorum]